MTQVVFTSAAILDLLRQVDELHNYDIDSSEQSDGSIILSIGSSSYTISASSAEEVKVTPAVIDQISDINDEAFDDLASSGDIELSTVESGIIKEIGKTLLVGGLVRLANKILKK